MYSSTSYAIKINGRLGNRFKPTRGLRQGDPLSLFLFLLYAEGFSAMLRVVMVNGILNGVRASKWGPQLSYLLFTNDSILFGEATTEDGVFFKTLLKGHEACSSQSVNYDKSTIIFSSNVTEGDNSRLANLMGMCISTKSERYLRLPNMVGKRKKSLSRC